MKDDEELMSTPFLTFLLILLALGYFWFMGYCLTEVANVIKYLK